MQREGTFTVQYNHLGEILSIEVEGKKLVEPTHNLVDRIPEGIYKGSSDLGKLYTYELRDGSIRRCVHRYCAIF